MNVPGRVIDRFISKLENGPNGCILSTYSTGSHGYSQVGWVENSQRTMVLGHRLAWEVFMGPIPSGMTIDHICHNRRCVNLAHLRLLSLPDNARGNGQIDKTHCPSGHPYSGSNLYLDPKGYRRCRECMKISKAKAKAST